MSRHLLPLMAGLSLLVGCEKREPPKSAAKEEYVARAQKAVDETRQEIDALKGEAREARADAKARLLRQIDEMEGRWRRAERKLRELERAGGEAWRDFRSGVDDAVADLKRPFAGSRQPGGD